MEKFIYSQRTERSNMTNNEAQTILKGCMLNERVAQKKLYLAFYDLAMSIALRYSSNPDNVSEMINDAFLKIFKNINSFVPRYDNITGSFIAWFKKVVAFSCIDYLRKYEKKEKMANINSEANIPLDESPTGISILTHKEIMKCVNHLPPGCKEVFSLYTLLGYSHAEIAGMLNISEGTSKSSLHRARKNLQHRLEKNNCIN